MAPPTNVAVYAPAVSDRLPLFPLGLVLFPGLLLPLHVFEDRYRVLIGELREKPEAERRFGVVAIRQGREVGEDGVAALHDVGCVAELRRIAPYDDGRYDIVTTGSDRFRLEGLERGKPYLQGDVTWLREEIGDADLAHVLDPAVRSSFAGYLDALATASAADVDVPDLPDDPLTLSYLVAATVLMDLEDRQRLLAERDATTRLRAELSLLRRESALLRALSSAPAPELTRTPVNPN